MEITKSTRFLELDSTYRNRNSDPNPASFTAIISQSGTRGKKRALDPISYAAPIAVWTPPPPPPPPPLATGVFVTATTFDTVIKSNQFVVNAPGGTYNKDKDYYTVKDEIVNPYLNLELDGKNLSAIGWDYINTTGGEDYFVITVDKDLDPLPATGSVVNILDPSKFDLGLIFIPGISSVIQGEINNYYIQNETTGEYVVIKSYDGNIATVDISTQLVNDWPGDKLILRKQLTCDTGKLGSGSSLSNVIIDMDSPTTDDFYRGDFLRVISNDENDNFVSRIVRYNGEDGEDGNDRKCFLEFPLPTDVTDDTTTYEILQFSKDNFVPFTYTGSFVSQQDMVCHEVSLVQLILPNTELQNGGFIAFYPYVYVELQNISSPTAGTKNAIYSNNPNATRKMFRVYINDIENPLITPFVTLDGGGMVQTLKFKPNDSFRFGVYLPNGNEFLTSESDNFSPISPKPLLQISALFGFKRL